MDFPAQWDTRKILRYTVNSTPSANFWIQTPQHIVHQGVNLASNHVSNFSMNVFSSLDAGLLGDFNIAEIMIYSGSLSAPDLQKVHSYLALKYGYTLDLNV